MGSESKDIFFRLQKNRLKGWNANLNRFNYIFIRNWKMCIIEKGVERTDEYGLMLTSRIKCYMMLDAIFENETKEKLIV